MTTRWTTRWTIRPTDPTRTRLLETLLGCPAPIAALLAGLGIDDPAAARRFFDPRLDDLHDPQLMLGMAEAVARIRLAVERAEPILIYGDYDVDGTTATVLLKTAIERIAPPGSPARVSFHVPHRLREGYGIQNVRLAEAAAEGVRLVISVDTGIRAFAAAAEAATLGLDLIVTDHHLPDGVEGVPNATAVLNPAQPGCSYPHKHLCGAGVAFKLAHALLRAHAADESQRKRLNEVLLPSFLKLVAIATVADSVPLLGENRTLVALGLRALANPVQAGLRALMQVAKLPLDTAPTAMEVGFRLAPRINAAGRMDVASDVVELLLTRDGERASSLARKLDELNQARRNTEAAALDAIELQLLSLRDAEGAYPSQCLVLDHPEWHRGVIGILASRVVERTGRPALVLTSGPEAEGTEHAHGSGRSVEGFHLLDALTAVHAAHHAEDAEELFARFGGHAHAVGFSLPLDKLPALRRRLALYSGGLLTEQLLQPELVSVAELSPADLTSALFDWVARCAPFGAGNPEPLFLLRGLTLGGPPRWIADRHVCLPLNHSVDGRSLSAMGWSRNGRPPWTERCEALGLQAGSRVDAVCRLRENTHPQYGGLELDLADLAPSKAPSWP